MKPEAPLVEDRQAKVPAESWNCPSVLEWVERHAQASPEATAVTGSAGTMTYGELNGRASHLAHRLRNVGVGRERLVGVYMERSAAAVVAALATFKAGGAYLPLDPALPVERLAFMLADAKVTAVVSTDALCRRLPEGTWSLVNVDEMKPGSSSVCTCSECSHSAGSGDDGRAEVSADDLAYVIYTSGSTGQPKGVEITHGSLMNLVSWHLRAFGVTSCDRATLQAAVGFDAAVWELWPYLAAGASVAIAEENVRNHPDALRDWLVANGITITFLPTAIAERMLTLSWPARTSLRILLTGAEALRKRPAANLPFVLINNYGPTENTVVATSGRVLADSSATLPSIGSAIDNTSIFILDEQMHPVAQGSVGEIYIGGKGVARGYRNQAALTRERFVRNPFEDDWKHPACTAAAIWGDFFPVGRSNFSAGWMSRSRFAAFVSSRVKLWRR